MNTTSTRTYPLSFTPAGDTTFNLFALIRDLRATLEEERSRKTQEIAVAVLAAREKEREEIGAELHDNVGQMLASSRLYLGTVRQEINYTHPHLEESNRLLLKSMDALRELSHELISPALDRDTFMQELNALVDAAIRHSGIVILKNIVMPGVSAISDKLRHTIFRIIQEQLNNILKHAEAKRASIVIGQSADRVTVVIRDDGRGFDPERYGKGVGLINIATRANLQGGTATITSAPGKGCEVKVVFKIE